MPKKAAMAWKARTPDREKNQISLTKVVRRNAGKPAAKGAAGFGAVVNRAAKTQKETAAKKKGTKVRARLKRAKHGSRFFSLLQQRNHPILTPQRRRRRPCTRARRRRTFGTRRRRRPLSPEGGSRRMAGNSLCCRSGCCAMASQGHSSRPNTMPCRS